jgi:hypothetical protein
LLAVALLVAVAAASGFVGGLAASPAHAPTPPGLDPVTARERAELTATAVRADLSSVVVVAGRVVPPMPADSLLPVPTARGGLEVVASVPASQLHRLPTQLTTLTVRLTGDTGTGCTVTSFAANVGPDGGGDPQLRCRLDPQVTTFVGLPVQVSVADLRLQGQVVPPREPAGHDTGGRLIARTGLDVVASVPASDLHRMPAEVTTLSVRIQHGPVTDCTFVSFAANIGPGGDADGGGDPQLRCRLGAEVATYVGLPAQIAVTVAAVEGVVALPLTAVDGSTGTGEVYLRIAHDEWRWQRVELGVNDGRRVEVTSGLSAGDVVADPAPSIFGGRP